MSMGVPGDLWMSVSLKMPILSILCNSAMSGSLGFEIEVDFGGLAAVFLKQVFICETINID